MAKLHNYYVLCPLIDQKSFLGVALDRDDVNVVVTLGRNVVNKYRLSDQKQLSGWTSKDHITAEVIYDKDQDSYVGVFIKNTIKIWKEDTDNLDKAKKYKFSLNILKVIPRKDQSSLIIFANGNCASLPYALDNRKSYESAPLIRDSETIVNIDSYTLNNTDYICYIVKNSKGSCEIINCPLREELGDLVKSNLTRNQISRAGDVCVVGKHINAWNKAVYILWSDSKLTSYDLVNKSWKTIGTVPWLSTLNSVSLAWMGKNHVIMFGSNTDQDGAIIVAYNITLGVGSCRYPMKMYTENARLYCFHDRIILEASNHIGMLPYVLETKRNLSSLLGSHEFVQDEHTDIANWDDTVTLHKLKYEIKEVEFSLPERSTCAQVVMPLLEKEDFRTVFKSLKQFDDVPETVLISLINYAIKLVNPNHIDVRDTEEFIRLCCADDVSKKEKIAQKAKFEFLNYILKIKFSDALIIPCLRNGLVLDNALFLMTYMSYLLIAPDMKIDDFESKLYDWCILLMDTFYQQYLISKDEKITYVLENTRTVVNNLIDQLTVVDNTLPILNKYLDKTSDNDEELLSYTIELIEI